MPMPPRPVGVAMATMVSSRFTQELYRVKLDGTNQVALVVSTRQN